MFRERCHETDFVFQAVNCQVAASFVVSLLAPGFEVDIQFSVPMLRYLSFGKAYSMGREPRFQVGAPEE